MMQITKPAWITVTSEPYGLAWDWKINCRNGIAYLAHLRQLLIKADEFSYTTWLRATATDL